MSDKKTAVIFARVGMDSTKSMEYLEGLLKQQVQDCRLLAKQNEMEVAHVIQFVGQSNYEKLLELMTYISDMDKPPHEIICLRFDRFSRDTNRLFQFIGFLNDYTINIRTLDKNYIDVRKLIGKDQDEVDMISILPEKSSPSHHLIRNMSFAIAQFEDGMKAESIIDAMQEKFKEGYWLWQAPFGYKRDKTTKEIVTDEDEAKIVLEIFHKLSVVKGEDRQQVVLDLAIKFNFPISRIEKIVANSFYAGEMCSITWNMFVMGRHKPLIDFETLRKAQK